MAEYFFYIWNKFESMKGIRSACMKQIDLFMKIYSQLPIIKTFKGNRKKLVIEGKIL